MRDTDYRQAKKLEDILKISKKDWNIHLETRNNCLMRLAKDSESVSELGVNQGTSFVFVHVYVGFSGPIFHPSK